MNQKQYIRMIQLETASAEKGKVLDAYVCRKVGCGEMIVTYQTTAGTTPAQIQCPKCRDMMHSQFFKVDPTLTPTHVFYRPTFEDFKKMPENGEKEHIKRGGLLLKRIEDPPKDVHAENAAKGKCGVQVFGEKFCTEDAKTWVLHPIVYEDGRKGETEIKTCVEHAVRLCVHKLVTQMEEIREAKKKFALASASPRLVKPMPSSPPSDVPDAMRILESETAKGFAIAEKLLSED